jgi:hypothetical protein
MNSTNSANVGISPIAAAGVPAWAIFLAEGAARAYDHGCI